MNKNLHSTFMMSTPQQFFIEKQQNNPRKRIVKNGNNIPNWFNAKAYYQNNKDISERFLFNPQVMWEHYNNFGKFENRSFTRERRINRTRQKEIFMKNSSLPSSFRLKPVGNNNLEKRFKNLNFQEHQNPTLSILLVTFNRIDCTVNCLESLHNLKNEVDFEIIIWDNNSTDQTLACLEMAQGIKLFKSDRNLHFLRAINEIAPKAKGEYILLLNNDTQVYPGSLKEGIKTFTKFDNVGSVGAKVILSQTQNLQEAGNYLLNGDPMGYGRNENPFSSKYNFARPVIYSSGCFLIIKNELFSQLGYFDIRYAPAYFEDTDLCMRILKKGLLNYYQPKCRIYHVENASQSKKYDPFKLMEMNSSIFKSTHEAFIRNLRYNPLQHVYRSRFEYRNLLWIENELPLKSKGSGYPRVHSILKYLASKNWFITYVAFWSSEKDINENIDMLPEGVEFIPANRDALTSLKLIESRRGFYKGLLISRVHVFKNMEKIVDSITKRFRLPLIYDMETLTSEREIMKKRLVSNSSISISLKEEVYFANKSNLVISVSDIETDILKKSGAMKEICCFGHILKKKGEGLKYSERYGFLFVGFMGVFESPNVDSIVWFIDHVWPLIKQQLPTAIFTIVGECCSKLRMMISKLKDSGIIIKGKISNEQLKELYKKSRVFVAPTRLFSGIPYKIHHVSSWGLPFVSSSQLLKNMGWENDFISSVTSFTPPNFAKSCIKLYTDPEVWEKERDTIWKNIENENSENKLKNLESRISFYAKKSK